MKGDVIFRQNSKFDPTFITIDITSARGDLESKIIFGSIVGGYKIHELPRLPLNTLKNDSICSTTKKIFNPTNMENDDRTPPPGKINFPFILSKIFYFFYTFRLWYPRSISHW